MKNYFFPKRLSCAEEKKTFHKKKWSFSHFCDFGKIIKMAKNPFFLKKSDFLLHDSLIIWENDTFSFSTLFGRIERKYSCPSKVGFFLGPFFAVFGRKMG